MSDETFIIKLDIASVWADDMDVVGWAINCIGDQVGDGKTTGPVWRGCSGPGVDDIGTFEILRPGEVHFGPENNLPTLLDHIQKVASQAYILAMEQKLQLGSEVEELARALWEFRKDFYEGDDWSSSPRAQGCRELAKSLLDNGYGKVK